MKWVLREMKRLVHRWLQYLAVDICYLVTRLTGQEIVLLHVRTYFEDGEPLRCEYEGRSLVRQVCENAERRLQAGMPPRRGFPLKTG